MIQLVITGERREVVQFCCELLLSTFAPGSPVKDVRASYTNPLARNGEYTTADVELSMLEEGG